MGYGPTGYKPGRPRKGEIRPETPGGKQAASWRERNYERSIEIVRESHERFREQRPERVKEIQRGVVLRRKGWGDVKLIPAEMTNYDGTGVIAVGGEPGQAIIIQVD